ELSAGWRYTTKNSFPTLVNAIARGIPSVRLLWNRPSIKSSANALSSGNRCSGHPKGRTCCYKHGPKSWMEILKGCSVAGTPTSGLHLLPPRGLEALGVGEPCVGETSRPSRPRLVAQSRLRERAQ